MDRARGILAVETPVQAIEANLVRYFKYLGGSPLMELHSEPGFTWRMSHVPHPVFNGVIETALSADRADDKIREMKLRAVENNLPITWWVGPSTSPADLGIRLTRSGFAHLQTVSGMAVDLLALRTHLRPPNELTIVPVSDIPALQEYMSVLQRAHNLPEYVTEAYFDFYAGLTLRETRPLGHYIGWMSGQPVATASRFVSDEATVGIYNVTTLPEFRRRGIGAAMSLIPLRETLLDGLTAGVLLAPQDNTLLYRELGFEEHVTYDVYLWPGASHLWAQ